MIVCACVRERYRASEREAEMDGDSDALQPVSIPLTSDDDCS